MSTRYVQKIEQNKMKVTAISDIHGHLTEIEPCDLLLICGDISPVHIQRDKESMLKWLITEFKDWILSIPCDKVIMTPGNHDFWFHYIYNFTEDTDSLLNGLVRDKLVVLIDEKYEYNGFAIYGTPWCKPIGTEDPEYPRWAFIKGQDKLNDVFGQIPFDLDILITHEAPNIGGVDRSLYHDGSHKSFGSSILRTAIESTKPRFALCGHVHTGNHEFTYYNGTNVCNCSILDENYDIEFKPITFEIENKTTNSNQTSSNVGRQ